MTSHDPLQGYRDDVIRSLMEKGWWEEGQVPMLVLAPFHVEEQFLAHWNMLRIGERRSSLSHDSHVIFQYIQHYRGYLGDRLLSSQM